MPVLASRPDVVTAVLVKKTTPDAALVRAYQGGDRRSFDALLARHARHVQTLLWHLTLSDELAARLGPKAWLAAHAQRLEMPSGGPVLPWLLGVAAQVAREAPREAKAQVPADAQPAVAALATLPEAGREALVLLDLLRLPLPDAARALATTEAQLSQRAQQAREQLGTKLGTGYALARLEPPADPGSLEKIAHAVLPVVARDLRPQRSYLPLVAAFTVLLAVAAALTFALVR